MSTSYVMSGDQVSFMSFTSGGSSLNMIVYHAHGSATRIVAQMGQVEKKRLEFLHSRIWSFLSYDLVSLTF